MPTARLDSGAVVKYSRKKTREYQARQDGSCSVCMSQYCVVREERFYNGMGRVVGVNRYCYCEECSMDCDEA